MDLPDCKGINWMEIVEGDCSFGFKVNVPLKSEAFRHGKNCCNYPKI